MKARTTHYLFCALAASLLFTSCDEHEMEDLSWHSWQPGMVYCANGEVTDFDKCMADGNTPEAVIFYIDDKEKNPGEVIFSDRLGEKVFLYRLIPGCDGTIPDALMDMYDAMIIESFGVGGIPDYGDGSLKTAIHNWISAGKIVVMATQVPNEGSDMSVYEVGHAVKNIYDIPESYDMTLEAVIAKTMWILGQTKDRKEFRQLFYTAVNHDLLFL